MSVFAKVGFAPYLKFPTVLDLPLTYWPVASYSFLPKLAWVNHLILVFDVLFGPPSCMVVLMVFVLYYKPLS